MKWEMLIIFHSCRSRVHIPGRSHSYPNRNRRDLNASDLPYHPMKYHQCSDPRSAVDVPTVEIQINVSVVGFFFLKKVQLISYKICEAEGRKSHLKRRRFWPMTLPQPVE